MIFFVKLTNRIGSDFYIRSDLILSMSRMKVNPNSIGDGIYPSPEKVELVELTRILTDGGRRPVFCKETPEEVQALLSKGDEVREALRRIEEMLKRAL